MNILIYAAIPVVAVAGALLLKKQRRREPSAGWSAGPIIDGKDYSSALVVDAAGSFDFPQSTPGVHYITKACGSLSTAKGIRFRYRIEADPQISFLSANDGQPVAIGPVLYFEREGDNWSGTGAMEAYRWWATGNVPPLTPGEHEITASFDDRWTAVETSNSIDNNAAFRAALARAARVGFTFPSDTGYGHGCYARGPARFVVESFEVLQ